MRGGERAWSLCAALALLCVGGCDGKPKPTPAPSKTSAPAGSYQPTNAPAKRTPEIPSKTALGPFNEGLALELRPLISHLTRDDALGFVLRIRPEKLPAKGDPAWSEALDFGQVLSSLAITVEGPKGHKQVLKLGPGSLPWAQRMLSTTMSLQLDAKGILFSNSLSHEWQAAPKSWLEETGTYRVSVSADFVGKTSEPGGVTSTRTVHLEAGPLEYHVEAPSARFRSLAELTTLATKWVQARQGVPKVKHTGLVLEDAAKNRSFRFTLDSPGYDITVIEVLLDPSGKEVLYDVFTHFTCVAEGTRIATPDGEVAVERLTPGVPVSSFEVATSTPTTARVTHVEPHNAVELVRLGGLEVTPHHPVFSDGRWVEAGQVAGGARLQGLHGQRLEVTPLRVKRPGVVYEISVTEPHTYFAAGLLLHNKAVHVPIGKAEDWQGLFHRRAATPNP